LSAVKLGGFNVLVYLCKKHSKHFDADSKTKFISGTIKLCETRNVVARLYYVNKKLELHKKTFYTFQMVDFD
jgi:hypothetical protein